MARRARSIAISCVLAAVSCGALASAPEAARAACPPASGDPYSTAVLADSPIAYYRLDEPSGPTLCDSSATATDGTYNASGVTYGVGGALPSDTAVRADGTNGVIGTGGASGITGNQSFTLESWYRRSGIAQAQSLVSFGATGLGQVAGLTTWVSNCGGSTSNVALDTFASSNCWSTTPRGINLFDARWHHLAIAYDATTGKATGYIDGLDLGAQTTATMNIVASSIRVGSWIDMIVNNPFIGDADEVAVYNKALPSSRVAAHYQRADSDSDGTPNSTDNCQSVPNPGQANNDGDARGDACDPDDDNDTVVDVADACPTQAASTSNGCPRATQAALPPPVLGKRFNAAKVAGDVFVSLPAARARTARAVPGLKGRVFVPLSQARQLPVGSILDTRAGTVRLTSASPERGKRFSGEFASGVFQVLQSGKASAKGLTELRLKGASFRRCLGSSGSGVSAARRRSRRTVRRLTSNANGRFRTRGRYSSATLRGTVWTTADRCDGTLTSVRSGRVTVRDFRRKRTIRLSAGKRYLARAPG